MKKRLIVILALVVVLTLSFSALAVASDTPAVKSIRGLFGLDASKLTDEQKADVESYSKKMADLQKDFINQMVENGAITKEQGEKEIERIDEMLEKSLESGFIPGFGMGKGFVKFHRIGDGADLGIADFSKLTEQQKADLINSCKQIAELRKELVNELVKSGLLTSEQGDAIITRIDETLAELQETGLTKGYGVLLDAHFLVLRKADFSEVTDEQKAILDDYSGKLADLRKDLVNKMVEYGALTEEQGKAAINRIEKNDEFRLEKGFQLRPRIIRSRMGRGM